MSIDDLILDRVRRGMLHPLMPRAPGVGIIRALFLGEMLHDLLTSPEGDDEWEQRVGELQADLERFLADPIDPKYLFLLYPARDAVWEIRSVVPDPSIRVLGLFPKRDVFVATNFASRAELGGWQSRGWREAKRLAGAIWRKVFGTYKPKQFTKISQLITGAISGIYFKDRA